MLLKPRIAILTHVALLLTLIVADGVGILRLTSCIGMVNRGEAGGRPSDLILQLAMLFGWAATLDASTSRIGNSL